VAHNILCKLSNASETDIFKKQSIIMITKMCFHFSSSVLLTLPPYCAEQGLFDGPLPVHPINRQQQWQPAGLLLSAQLVGYISQYMWCSYC